MKKMIAGAVLLVSVGAVVMAFFAYDLMRVANGSMEPTLPVGSFIIVQEQEAYDIGDVISFRADDGHVVTHRLVQYDEGGTLITKGDANPTDDVWDRPLKQADVIGKTVQVITITTPQFWASSSGLILGVCIVLVVGALWWYCRQSGKSEKEEEPVS